MTAAGTSNRERLDSGANDALTRVRNLDPDCTAENVVRFFREIDAALLVLQQLDATGYPLSIAFDPRWSQGQER